ncbi:MAG TPA: potassium transporter Kup [Burkholderiales bacterium]|nr:potassium transporter Kup [Burkholderiales bacterium]
MNRAADAIAVPAPAHAAGLPALTLAALGIVYGDIGTSPLYAVKETFNPAHGIPLSAETVIGGISGIFWALMIVVSLKYVVLIMRADNRGEGGVMALLALASSATRRRVKWSGRIAVTGLIGVALFYGDAVLTPAISVLSAVEGLEIETVALKPYVLPIAIGVLVGLFVFQKHGTAAVGKLFGPVVIIWFLAIGAVGVQGIVRAPQIVQALNPLHALAFVTQHGFSSFVVLGAILLAFTGAEALYADMGHFGKQPIRLAWFGLVFPALTLNYLGQGALLIVDPKAVENPFYHLVPPWALLGMVALATAATIIASQATISGAYSLTRQAVQLGYLPRINVQHTSETAFGQIYVPAVNWTLLAAVLAAVVGFGSSTSLASAYGVAVTGTMLVTTILTFFVIRYRWHYSLLVSVLATMFFIAIDSAFFTSSLLKIGEGGWFPLTLGTLMLLVMLTWRRGRHLVSEKLRASAIDLEACLASLLAHPPHRVAGTSVFLVANPDVVPRSLLHNLAHNKVLHERVVFLTVIIDEVPYVSEEERLVLEPLGEGCWRLKLTFGFMEEVDVPRALTPCALRGLPIDLMDTSFFLSREKIISTPGEGMWQWREHLFGAMARNAGSAPDYFNLPANRVVELGTQVEI